MKSEYKTWGLLILLALPCLIIVLGISIQGFITFIAALLCFALALLIIGLKIRRIIK